MSARLLLLGLLLLPSIHAEARSTSTSAEPAVDTLRGAGDCPALFGGSDLRTGNSKRRSQLYWVEQEAGGVTVAHRSDEWDEPIPFRIRGVELRWSRRGKAAVELSSVGAASLGCRAGRYRLTVDDGLTHGVRVLALLEGVVLVERGHRLAYLLAPGARAPRWLVAWSAPGLIRVDGAGEASDNIETSYRRYPHSIRSPYRSYH